MRRMAEPAPPPAWIVRLNTTLLRRGLRIGSQHLLSVVGRKSGVTRHTPVSLALLGPRRFIVAAFAEAAWVGNVRAAGRGILTRGGKAETVRLVEIPTDERGPVLRVFLDQVRGGRRFFGTDDPDVVAAAAERYPVFEILTGDE